MSRADECTTQCQIALDYDTPEYSCKVCHYAKRPEQVDFVAALHTARHNAGFSNLARAYVELLKRAQAGREALAAVNVVEFSGVLKEFEGELWLRRVRDAANDLDSIRQLKGLR